MATAAEEALPRTAVVAVFSENERLLQERSTGKLPVGFAAAAAAAAAVVLGWNLNAPCYNTSC